MFRALGVSGRENRNQNTSELLDSACEVPSGTQVVAVEPHRKGEWH